MGTERTATAFAPATVANVAVGFDVLGFALEGVGDRVTVSQDPDGAGERVAVERIEGVVTDLPLDPGRNSAAAALRAMVDDVDLPGTFRVTLHKGIPLASGMGGSAASAVAAVVAANALLESPAPREVLLRWVLEGEAAGSGARHADNAAACLYGGLVAVLSVDPPVVAEVPVPECVLCVLVHPHLMVETREARSVLRAEIGLEEHVRQSARLAGFVTGCCRGDLELIRGSMEDLLIEPQRSSLIPGFDRAKAAAREHGALGFSISGSGPSVFAWVASREAADDVARVVTEAFRAEGVESDSRISTVNAPGASAGSG